MAIDLPTAHLPDLAGIYLQGRRTAAELSIARQRISQEQAETTARLQAAAAQQAQEATVEQQRIQVSQAYHQQQGELRKERLAQIEAVNAEKTQAAARAFEAKQAWQTGLDRIDNDTKLNPEQKHAEKTKLVMRLAPVMGIAGTEAGAMIRSLAPIKPTVPASVTDKGEFVQVTQPNGTVTIHNKPSGGAKTVKVKVDDTPGGIISVPEERARALVSGLPTKMAEDPINLAVIASVPVGPYNRVPKGQARPGEPASNVDNPVTKLDTEDDVRAAYRAGKLTREQAKKMLQDDFGWKE